MAMLFGKKKKKKDDKALEKNVILVGSKHNFIFTESYKSLRTNMLFSLPKEGCRKIMITSPLASEGKSTVSAHLAASFADMGANVLLIDCDLRRGKTHKFFELKRSPGLANVLAGFSDVNTAIQKTKIDKLYVLSAGVVPPNPAELLATNRMSALIEEFSKTFDFIILDTSPVNIVSDALPLVGLADGVAVVCRQNYTDQTALDRCIHNLEFAEAKIMGVILNDVAEKTPSRARKYGYYKGGYYGGYYGGYSASARKYSLDESTK